MNDHILKLDVKVNLDKLRDYYHTVEESFQNLCWTAKGHNNSGVGGHRVDDVYGWAIETNSVDLNKPSSPYNISSEKNDTYRDTELVFGIIHAFKSSFPMAHGYGIAVHPPASFINFHTDTDTFIKIHVPVYTNDTSFFCFRDKKYNMKADGSMYLVDTRLEHGTDNQGDTNRIHLIFKIPEQYDKIVQTFSGVIQ